MEDRTHAVQGDPDARADAFGDLRPQGNGQRFDIAPYDIRPDRIVEHHRQRRRMPAAYGRMVSPIGINNPYGAWLLKMIVPDAANIPPTPWHTEIFAPSTCAGATPRICRTLSCSAYIPYMPECM